MSQIIFTNNASNPGTPSSGRIALYSKTDKHLYFISDDGVEHPVVDSPNYGMITITKNTTVLAVTAAVDATLTTNSDYHQLSTLWDALPINPVLGITQGTGTLTIQNTRAYEVKLWATVTASNNNVNMAFRYAVNGVISLGRRPMTTIASAGNNIELSAYGFVNLNAGDVVTLWYACDTSTNLTFKDLVFSIKSL